MPFWYLHGDHWSSHDRKCTNCNKTILVVAETRESENEPPPPQKTSNGTNSSQTQSQPKTQSPQTGTKSTVVTKTPTPFVQELQTHTEKNPRSNLKGGVRTQQSTQTGKVGGGNSTGPSSTPKVNVGGGNPTGPSNTPKVNVGGGNPKEPSSTPKVTVGSGHPTGPSNTPKVNVGGGNPKEPSSTPKVTVGSGNSTGPSNTPKVNVGGGNPKEPSSTPKVTVGSGNPTGSSTTPELNVGKSNTTVTGDKQPTEFEIAKSRVTELLRKAAVLLKESSVDDEKKQLHGKNLQERRDAIISAVKIEDLAEPEIYLNKFVEVLTKLTTVPEKTPTGSGTTQPQESSSPPIKRTPSSPRREKLSPQQRTERNEKLSKQLQELGILGPPVMSPLPVATASPLPQVVVQPGTGVPKNEELNKKSEVEFKEMYEGSAKTILEKLREASYAEYSRYYSVAVDIWNLKSPTNYIEKLSKLTNACKEMSQIIQAETKAKNEFDIIYKKCETQIEEIGKINLDKRNLVRNVHNDVLNLTDTFASKLKQIKLVSAYLVKVVNEDNKQNEEKKVIAEKAAKEVMGWKPEKIEAMKPDELVDIMARLTCPKEPPKDAIAKLYRFMKPDPEFCDEDKKKREKVLEYLSPEKVEDGITTWTNGNELEKDDTDSGQKQRNIIEEFQKQQIKTLGFDGVPTIFKKLETGNAGVGGLSGVTVSSNSDDNKTFDEVINTVDHETTHAYQGHLEKKLTDGELKPDDPLYAQTVLFLLNSRAYQNPPEKVKEPKPLEGKDAENPTKKAQYEKAMLEYKKKFAIYQDYYQSYKNQPTEEHAWKSGDEAGRLVKDLAEKNMNGEVMKYATKHLGQKSLQEATDLVRSFKNAKDLTEKKKFLEKLKNLEVVI